MASPFERTAAELANRIRTLDLYAQVLLFATAARALSVGYLTWARETNQPAQGELLDRAIEHAVRFGTGEADAVERSLLETVEAATPSIPNDSLSFTAAQDSWVLIDTALRTALGEFDAGDSVWYLLEPMYQATLQRLFGVSDAGSDRQEDAELIALNDEQLAETLGGLNQALDLLEKEPEMRGDHWSELLLRRLKPIAPR